MKSKKVMIDYLDHSASEDLQDYYYAGHGLTYRDHLESLDDDDIRAAYENAKHFDSHRLPRT